MVTRARSTHLPDIGRGTRLISLSTQRTQQSLGRGSSYNMLPGSLGLICEQRTIFVLNQFDMYMNPSQTCSHRKATCAFIWRLNNNNRSLLDTESRDIHLILCVFTVKNETFDKCEGHASSLSPCSNINVSWCACCNSPQLLILFFFFFFFFFLFCFGALSSAADAVEQFWGAIETWSLTSAPTEPAASSGLYSSRGRRPRFVGYDCGALPKVPAGISLLSEERPRFLFVATPSLSIGWFIDMRSQATYEARTPFRLLSAPTWCPGQSGGPWGSFPPLSNDLWPQSKMSFRYPSWRAAAYLAPSWE